MTVYITAETRVISGWKNDLESCARDFLRVGTIQKFDQQFHLFLAGMRRETLSHVNQTNSEHQLNVPPFYNSSEESSRNLAAYQGQFNHGEFHSQILNVTGQVENNKRPERMEYEQDDSDVSSESDETPPPPPPPGVGQMNLPSVKSEFQPQMYPSCPVVEPGIYPSYPVVEPNLQPGVYQHYPVFPPFVHPNHSTGINPVVEPIVKPGVYQSYPVCQPFIHPNCSTGINPVVEPIDHRTIWINGVIPMRAPPGFFEFNASMMDRFTRIDPYDQLKALSSLIILHKFLEGHRSSGDSGDNSTVDLPVNIVDDSSDEENSDNDSFDDLSGIMHI